MPLRLITPPSAEPIALGEMKSHLRVDSSDDDVYIAGLLAAARWHVEEITWRQLLGATWRLTLDRFPPGREILVPRPPLMQVTSITYVDMNGTTQTLDTDDYQVDVESEPGRIQPAYGLAWPVTRHQLNVVTITYEAGFYHLDDDEPVSEATDVPAPLVEAIRFLVGHWHMNRETVVTGTIATNLPQGLDAILMPWHCHDDRVLEFC